MVRKWYRLLWEYVRQYRLSGFLFFLFSAIFAGIFYLYDLETEAVAYGACICGAAAAVILGLHFFFFYREHKERMRLLAGIELTYAELPRAKTLLEADYQQMIEELGRISAGYLTDWKRERKDSLDYYTVWVHQIKTPIAAMHVLLQAASESQVEDERTAGEHWKDKEMKLELFKIEQYVEMVLTYLRMEDMSSDMSFEICELDSVIRQAVRKYSQMFILRKIKLDYVPVETKILTDEKWLVFVVEQILSNALKYTHSYSVNERSCSMEDADMNVEQGRISIYMEEYEPAQHGSGVDITESYGAVSRGKKRCLVIEDTGIGICPEDLPRVFEKGFTGYNGRKDKKSTGIGLYLCKAVMDRLRHQIWIESEAGEGTKVYLSLARENMRHE